MLRYNKFLVASLIFFNVLTIEKTCLIFLIFVLLASKVVTSYTRRRAYFVAFSPLDLEGCIDGKNMNHKLKNKEFESKPIVTLDLIFL